jgi:hypothetical protein
MLRKFVSNYFRKKLVNYFREQRRQAKVLSLSHSRNIGILWNPVDEGSLEAYESLRKMLKEKAIDCVGIAHLDTRKAEQHFSLMAHSGFSNNTNISFSGQPLTGPGVQFLQEAFDMVIDLSINKVLALEYLLVHSNAKFKIGWQSKGMNYYDMNIDIARQPSCRYLLEQVIYYLEKIDENQRRFVKLRR